MEDYLDGKSYFQFMGRYFFVKSTNWFEPAIIICNSIQGFQFEKKGVSKSDERSIIVMK